MKAKTITALLIITLSLAFGLVVAESHEGQCHAAYLFNAWARSSPDGAPNSAAYGLLVNFDSEEDTLVSASTDVAETVELHEVILGSGDVMQMQPVEGGIVVQAGGAVQLMPGGLHVMLINLTGELKAGDRLDITLKFEDDSEQTLSVPVRVPAAEGMPMGNG